MPFGSALRRPGPGSPWSALGGVLAPPLCWSCDGPGRRGESLCRRCHGLLHRLAAEPVWLSGVRVWAPFAYSGPARDLVRALKFRGATGVADAMAARMVANAPPGWLDEPTEHAELLGRFTLVPVPLHPRRLRSRGYNQAATIADALARRAGLAVADCLARTGPALTQVGRHRAERRAGPAGAIGMRGAGVVGPPSAIGMPGARAAGALDATAPARVLLVDDVVTTGATLAASRAALVTAGSVEVAAVVFARTLGR
jgi:predicted amidophosphoribosyltransferase